MSKKIYTIILFFLVIIAFLFFFTKKENKQNLQKIDGNNLSTERVIIEHMKGETEVPRFPQKVIVFDTALLDSFALLGIDVAGVPQPNIPYPEVLAKYKDKKYLNVGSLQEPDFEVISAAAPDLIIASGRAEKAYNELSTIAPTIMLNINFDDYYGSMKEQILLAAKLFNKEKEAIDKITKLDEKVAQTKEVASKAGTALFVLVNGGRVSAYGPGSRFGFIYDELGMKPVATFDKAGTHGNIISFEYILDMDPDWIFVLDRETAIGESQVNAAAMKVFDNELIHKTKAYKNNHIIYVDSPALYLAGGLQTYQAFVDNIYAQLTKEK